MSDNSRLEDIQRRIETASARNTDRASRLRQRTATFIDKHPIATVASGLVAGALLAAFLPKGRLSAKNATRTRKWSLLAIDTGLALAQRSWQSARAAGRAGQESFEQLGDRVSDGTAGLRKGIGRFTEDTARTLLNTGQQASQQVKSVSERIGSHLRH